MKPFRCAVPSRHQLFLLCAHRNCNRLVADEAGKYKTTAALIFSYATSVLKIQGNIQQVFR